MGDGLVDWRGEWARQAERAAAAESLTAQFRQALEEFGWHSSECPRYDPDSEGWADAGCTCGFDDAVGLV